MNKPQKKIENWYEQNEFWHVTSPILFRKARWKQIPEEVENIISLLGIKKARKAKVKIEFIKDDMRRFCKRNTFDAVINLFTSFGYFENQEDDYRVVQNIYTSLKKGGVFLSPSQRSGVYRVLFDKPVLPVPSISRGTQLKDQTTTPYLTRGDVMSYHLKSSNIIDFLR